MTDTIEHFQIPRGPYQAPEMGNLFPYNPRISEPGGKLPERFMCGMVRVVTTAEVHNFEIDGYRTSYENTTGEKFKSVSVPDPTVGEPFQFEVLAGYPTIANNPRAGETIVCDGVCERIEILYVTYG